MIFKRYKVGYFSKKQALILTQNQIVKVVSLRLIKNLI